MHLLKFLGFLFCIFHASASISADMCKEYPHEYPDLLRCQGNNCPKLLQTSPSQFKNLKLVAACDYQIQNLEGVPSEVGIFIFQGEQVVSGVLRREPSEFINEFTLRGEKTTPWPAKRPVFFRHEIYLQFPDALKAEKTFRTPKANRKTPCWEAKATLKVTEMHSIFGRDNTEGDYPQKYSVVEIAPYRKCLNPTPDPFAQ
jgi:hypothetical protein